VYDLSVRLHRCMCALFMRNFRPNSGFIYTPLCVDCRVFGSLTELTATEAFFISCILNK